MTPTECQLLCWPVVYLGSAVRLTWIILLTWQNFAKHVSTLFIGRTVVEQVGIIVGRLA